MNLTQGALCIRNATVTDAQQLVTWWNDGTVMSHAGFPKGLCTTVEREAGRIAAQTDETGRRHVVEYEGQPIGEMSYHNAGDGIAEIGIKICDFSMQNRGLGKVLLTMFIEGLFTQLGYRQIRLDTNLQNTRAQHVYEQLGFTRVRVNKDSWTDQLGRLQSSVDYTLVPEDLVRYTL